MDNKLPESCQGLEALIILVDTTEKVESMITQEDIEVDLQELGRSSVPTDFILLTPNVALMANSLKEALVSVSQRQRLGSTERRELGRMAADVRKKANEIMPSFIGSCLLETIKKN